LFADGGTGSAANDPKTAKIRSIYIYIYIDIDIYIYMYV